MKNHEKHEVLAQNYFYRVITKILFVTLFAFCSQTNLAQKLLFSEIMFMPSESNSEFIEIVNVSDTLVDLTGFKIKYHTTSPDEIIPQSSIYILSPNQYAIIFEADYDLANGIYKTLIPDSVLVFFLDDNAFGSGGMANTSDRSVYLISALDDTLDTHTYSANNSNGYSDERVSFNDSIWQNSNILNGTPGFKNSVALVEYDVKISRFFTDFPYYIIGNSVDLNILVKNGGIKDAQNIDLTIYSDINKNGFGESSEIIFNQLIENISPSDSITIKVNFRNVLEGKNNFITEVKYEDDENIFNNFGYLTFTGIRPNEDRGNIVINEFMYAPYNSEPEWIEIFNRSEKVINIKGYRIADNSDTINVALDEIELNSNQYLVIADDSSIAQFYDIIPTLIITNLPTLNNSGDKIIIMDSLNRIIDSLEYISDWGGNNGKSLEKIDAAQISWEMGSWKESKHPTPGKINSVTQKVYDLRIDSAYTNPKFPIVGTKFKISADIKNVGKKENNFTLSLYINIPQDSLTHNLLTESETINLLPNDSVSYEFNYESQIGEGKQTFLIVVNSTDEDTTNNKYYLDINPSYPANSLVINEIMYSSGNNEPEWVELYNNSEFNINLFNWSIGDVLSKPVFKSINESFVIGSKEYLIISKSNAVYDFHRNIGSRVLELAFANLNNDEDGVVIKDINGKTIDSLKYVNNWSSKSGHSLERISVFNSSINENNWSSSINIEGSSPGRINSVTPKDYDLVINSITWEPNFPVEGDKVKLFIDLLNRGKNSADDYKVDLFSVNENGNHLVETMEQLYLSAEDSTTLESQEYLVISDTIKIIANISFALDEDISNNYLEEIIIPGFNRNAVLLNEIMFKPNAGEPEWVEIINNSDSVVNLQNWLIGDLSRKIIITETETLMEPNEYLIISENDEYDSFPSGTKVVKTILPDLSNSKDAIIIYDYRNAIIDSMNYDVSTDFSISVSLERVSLFEHSHNLENWTFSINPSGSTPNEENSISSLPNNNFGDVIFTEIMFDPSDQNSEFLEFHNMSDESIEIGGWSISDEKGRLFIVSSVHYELESNTFFTVSADSLILDNYSWLSESKSLSVLNETSLNLNNTDKQLYLKDVKNNIIDSLHYFSAWHNKSLLETKNISLELINFNLNRNLKGNWSSSVAENGATPGRDNSINVKNVVTKAKLEITPNPFSPDNDGFEDFTFINYNLTQPISQIRLRIFDSKGRLVRNVANNQLIGSKGTILFDGLDEKKDPLKMGIYIILFEAVNSSNVIVEVMKEVVVVARKL